MQVPAILNVRNLLSRVSHYGSRPNEDEDVQLKKSLLILNALTFAGLAIIWSAMYMYFGYSLSAIIPFVYSAISCISILHFLRTQKYRFFRFSQLLLILLLPSILQFSLGGFTNGSAVSLWSLICPLGALLFDKPRKALYWFLAFLAIMVVLGISQGRMSFNKELSESTVLFFFVLNLSGVGFMIFLLVSYFVKKKNLFQQRSEDLLLNIMPKDIVPVLKGMHGTVANLYTETSILFADLVDFTPMASRLPPQDLVRLLNQIFTHFDGLVDKYGLEKIKTIGDCYMVAAGVPQARKDHASILVKLAVEMLDFIEKREIMENRLHLRVGISSGEVVAGVIGQRKFAYDMWGDTVNTASRMESQGKAGRIQLSDETYQRVKDEISCEFGGTIDVKGKGKMDVWLVKN